MPKVVRVLDVIKTVDELALHLGILDIVFVVVVREVGQITRGAHKRNTNQALAGTASKNLASTVGIAGDVFDTASDSQHFKSLR